MEVKNVKLRNIVFIIFALVDFSLFFVHPKCEYCSIYGCDNVYFIYPDVVSHPKTNNY